MFLRLLNGLVRLLQDLYFLQDRHVLTVADIEKILERLKKSNELLELILKVCYTSEALRRRSLINSIVVGMMGYLTSSYGLLCIRSSYSGSPPASIFCFL